MSDGYNSKLTQLQECLINIDMLARNILDVIAELNKQKILPTNVIFKIVNRYNFIQFCSFLDELNHLGKLAKNDQYLKDTLYIIAPIHRTLKKWNGIRDIRNKMYAHLNRDNSGNFYPWWITMKDIRIPKTFHENIIVASLFLMIQKVLLSRYYDLFNEGHLKIKDEYADSLNQININNKNMTISELESLKVSLIEEVEKRMNELGAELYEV